MAAQVQLLESRVLLSSVTISNATVAEPLSGEASMVFTLTRTGDLTDSVGVAYETQDGTAQAGVDYTATSGIAYFGINNSTTTISVPVLSNPQFTGPESFTVKLTGLVENPPAFTGTTNFSVAAGPGSVAVADFNGDGKPDLLVGTGQKTSFSVLFNNTTAGATTPSFGTAQTFSPGGRPAWVATADLNGDGKPDIITANYYSSNLGIYVNETSTGASTINLLSEIQLPAGSSPSSLVVTDVNGDGKPDIVVMSGSVNVLINTTATDATTPTFTAVQSFGNTLSLPRRLLVTDLNGDGKPDIAATALYGQSAMVMMSTTVKDSLTASFDTPVYVPTGNLSRGIASADLTGDGQVYVAMVSGNDQTVTILPDTTAQGASSFTYGTPIVFHTQESLTSVSFADVNGDGQLDLIAGGANTNHFLVYTNTTAPGATTPTFGNPFKIPSGNQAVSFQAFDFNADGITDLAYSNNGSSTVSVALGNPLTIGTSTATGTITINPASLPSVTIANATVVEPMSGQVSMVFTLTRTGDLSQSVGVAYQTQDGTAQAGVDYTASSGIAYFDINNSTTTITVPVLSNPQFTGPESFTVKLSVALGNPLTIGTSTATGTITINPASLPSVTIADATVAEPGSGEATMVFTLTRTGDLTDSVGVAYETQDGTAKAGIDYTASSGIAYFGINNSTTTISVPVLSNPQFTGPESFTVKLTGLVDNPPAFTGTTNFSVMTGPDSVAVDDFNGDGKLDLLVGTNLSTNFSVLFNNTTAGSLTPSFGTAQSFSPGGRPAWVATADLNGDGKPDIITANYYSSNLGIYINETSTGASTINLLSEILLPAGSSPSSLVVTDVNGDGKPDIVVMSGSVNVLINTTPADATTPTFTAVQSFSNTLSLPRRLLVTDLNGDGKPDIAVTALYGQSAMVMMSTTEKDSLTASFATPVYVPTGNLSRGIASADLTGDGQVFIAIVSANDKTVTIFPDTTAQGASSFTHGTPIVIQTPGGSAVVLFADVNGDGRPDLIVGGENATHFLVYPNTTAPGATTPTFGNPFQIPSGSVPLGLQASDFNNDGITDLVFANNGSNSVGVTLGNSLTIGASTATGTIDFGPAIGSFDTTVAYTANAGSVVLDQNATVIDPSAPRFDGGTLTVNLNVNAEATDRLSFRPVASVLGVSGSNLTFRGTVIGTITGGAGTTALVITFNSNATASAVQYLVRNLTFQSLSANPSSAPRTVQVTLTDGMGGTSNLPTKQITIAAGAPVAPALVAIAAKPVAKDVPGISLPWSGASTPSGPSFQTSNTADFQTLTQWVQATLQAVSVDAPVAAMAPGSIGGSQASSPPLPCAVEPDSWNHRHGHHTGGELLSELRERLTGHPFDELFTYIDRWL